MYRDMIRKISNKKLYLILIALLKCLNLVTFEYPYHKFKLSIIGIFFIFLHLLLHVWHKIHRIISFGYALKESTKVLNSTVLFYEIYKPVMQLLSFVCILVSQKNIYRLFKRLDVFNSKISKKCLNVSNNFSLVLILFTLDITLSIYIFDGYYLDCMLEILAFMPMIFYILVVYFVILRLEGFEIYLR